MVVYHGYLTGWFTTNNYLIWWFTFTSCKSTLVAQPVDIDRRWSYPSVDSIPCVTPGPEEGGAATVPLSSSLFHQNAMAGDLCSAGAIYCQQVLAMTSAAPHLLGSRDRPSERSKSIS